MSKIGVSFHKNAYTPVRFPFPEWDLGLGDRVFFEGSCFADTLCAFLSDRWFPASRSPFGATYNPLSMADNLNALLERRVYTENDSFESAGLWRHFSFHTKASRPTLGGFLTEINTRVAAASEALRRTRVLVLSFGTAWVYRLASPAQVGTVGSVVNNCHKLPESRFRRELLEVGAMAEAMDGTIRRLRAEIPGLRIVLSLSPVRHLGDRADENSLSKARLRCLIHELAAIPGLWYFPAYEIVLDELRDYRWYGDDLCHPNDAAADYVMRRFCEGMLDAEAASYLVEADQLFRDQRHRPITTGTAPEAWSETLRNRVVSLRKRYPNLQIPDWTGAVNGGQ